jgi:hypothetical protein
MPTVADLMERFLARSAPHARTAFSAEGVEPYDLGATLPTDPVLAWHGAGGSGALPPDWSEWVQRSPSVLALPWSAGHFPQQVRAWTQLTGANWLTRTPLVELPSELARWVQTQLATPGTPVSALAAGLWRQAGHAAAVAEWWHTHRTHFAADYAHELAAAQLAVDGDWRRAAQAWGRLPDSGPVCFNRGVAAVVLGDLPAAHAQLTNALAYAAAGQPWHHLAQVYRLSAS